MREVWVCNNEGGKGRAFRGVVYAHVEADSLWEGGRGAKETYRPIYAVVGSGEAEASPFMANLRLGYRVTTLQPANNARRSKYNDNEYEFLRSAQYAWRAARYPGIGTITQAYMPEFYRLDPGLVDPAGVRFGLLPSVAWTDAHASHIDARAMLAHLKATHWPRIGENLLPAEAMELTRVASLFLVYLDRRTRCPLVPDSRFALQVLVSALEKGYATRGNTEKTRPVGGSSGERWGRGRWGYVEEFITEARLHPGIMCHAEHKHLEPFLANEVAIYFAVRGKDSAKARSGRGKTPIGQGGIAFTPGLGASPS